MLSSIRWRLQLWHAGILVMAVVGIGATAFFGIRHARYAEIDSQMTAAGQVLVAKLRGPDHRPPRFDDGRGPGNDLGGPMDGPGFDGPPPGMDNFFGGPPIGPRPDRLPRNIELPPGFLQGYGGNEKDARSFVLYRPGKGIIKAWGVPYNPANLLAESQSPLADKPDLCQRGSRHEILLAAPEHTVVLVSGSVQQVDDELRELIKNLAAAAGVIMGVGLVGGGVISRLALRPIGLMSNTAGSISATQLSGRIDSRRIPTELRQLADVLNETFARLEAAFAQQARFTADASHDLRTPISVILTHTELALSRDRTADEYRKTIETCQSAANRMKSLVESLLLLSHADVGELSLQPCPMDLSDVVRDGVSLLTTLAEKQSITIATHLQNATLIGDPSRLGQVVANLIGNAIRYNHEGGSISVTTEVLLDDAVLTVADTGPGISPEDQKHVFDRFFRADKARSRESGGNGLGLAICKSIVEAHGGTIQLQSELGSGTTFIVRVPRGTEASEILALPEPIEV